MRNRLRRIAAMLVMFACMGGCSVAAYAGGPDYEEPKVAVTENPMKEKESLPLTPEGTGTVLDNVTDEDGKEFYTIMTPDEHIFFLIIDKQREAENVYFLDSVTEKDLLSLTGENAAETEELEKPEAEPCRCTVLCEVGEVDTACPVCLLDRKQCKGETRAADAESPKPETVKRDRKGSAGAVVLIAVAALAAGGTGYYFKILKPRRELDAADDFDDIEFLDGPEEDESAAYEADGEGREE